jgi:hypothetical protein
MSMPMIKASHRGLLHKEMGIPEGETISIGDLMKKKSKDKKQGNGAGEKRDTFAINARNWSHK